MNREELLALADCEHCPLAGRHNPVFGSGPERSRLVLVGMAPGADEAKGGRPFMGRSGQLVDATLRDVGLDRADIRATNVVACQPPKKGTSNDPPTQAIKCCSKRLAAELEEAQAEYIVAFGGVAAKTLLDTKRAITDLIGIAKKGPYGWIFPTYHPASVLRGSHRNFDDIHETLQRAARILRGELPSPENEITPDFEYADSWDGCQRLVRRMLDKWRHGDWFVSVDVETGAASGSNTGGFNWQTDIILQIGFDDGEDVFILDVRDSENSSEWAEVRRGVKRLLERKNIHLFLHNGASVDSPFLRQWCGVKITWTDTLAESLGTTENGQMVGLERMSQQLFGASPYKEVTERRRREAYEADQRRPKHERRWSEFEQVPFNVIDRHELALYLARDVRYTRKLAGTLPAILREEGTTGLVRDHLVPLMQMFADLRFSGAKVDTEAAGRLAQEWVPVLTEATEAMQAYARDHGFDPRDIIKKPKNGAALNPKSPKQLSHFVYNVLGLGPIPKEKLYMAGGSVDQYTTGKLLLEHHEGNPFVELLRTYKELEHLYTNYILGVLDDVWGDGLVHLNFLLWGTITGRIVIKSPEVQTIPGSGTAAAEKHGKKLRALFIPRSPQYLFVSADYERLELWIGATLSGDTRLAAELEADDFHNIGASRLFKVPRTHVTPLMRFRWKSVAFGVAYGRQAPSIAAAFQISVQEAQAWIDEFNRMYPQYRAWQQMMQRKALEDGYIRTPFGRKRRWNLITDELENHIKNQAVNAPVQSTASDLCLHAGMQLHETLPKWELGDVLFFVHDSIAAEIPREPQKRELALATIKYIMEEPRGLPEPLAGRRFPVEVKYGENWGEATIWENEHRLTSADIPRDRQRILVGQ